MKRHVSVPVFLILLVVGVGCGKPDQPSPEETTITVVGQVAPGFDATTLDGDPFSLAETRGKVVLVNFFATWCPPCREEIPHLEALWNELRGEGFVMIGLAREETEDVVRPFVEANGMSFPVACDQDRSVYANYAEQYIPRNIVIGREGTILFQSSGFEKPDFERMVQTIRNALAAN